MINVGQYSSPMEHMGLKEPIGSRKPPKKNPSLFLKVRKVAKVNFMELDLDEGDEREEPWWNCQQMLHHLPIVVFPWSC